MLHCLLQAAKILDAGDGVVPQTPSAFCRGSLVDHYVQTSSDEDDSCVPRAPSPKSVSAKGYRRCPETHNEVEKRRRALLTKCYSVLHDLIPSIAGTKASNVTVLRSAAEYIKELEQEEKQLINAKATELKRREQALSALALARATVMPKCEFGGPAFDGYTDEEDFGAVVPDTLSRCASPHGSPREDFTEVEGGRRRGHRRGSISGKGALHVLADIANGPRAAGKTPQRMHTAVRGTRRTSRIIRKKVLVD